MIDDRSLALAGLVQALKQVRRIADTGQADSGILATSLDSVFRIDAASPEEVYGGARNVRPGLLLLRDYLANQGDDPQLPKLALSVTQLERRFVASDAVAERVHDGILELRPKAAQLGSTHPEVLAALGSLYADTVSHLRPKVMVQGNPHYLGQAGVVAEIRAILLAALRSAVLLAADGRQRLGHLPAQARPAAVDRRLAGLTVGRVLTRHSCIGDGGVDDGGSRPALRTQPRPM